MTNAEGRLLRYYATRSVQLQPREWLTYNDKLVIITGRSPMSHQVTKLWVAKNIPRAAIFFATTPEIEALFAQERYAEGSALLGKRKLEFLQEIDAQVHIDNNPIIVRVLRKAGIVALQYGGAVWPVNNHTGSA